MTDSKILILGSHEEGKRVLADFIGRDQTLIGASYANMIFVMSDIKGVILVLRDFSHFRTWLREIKKEHFLKSKPFLLYLDHGKEYEKEPEELKRRYKSLKNFNWIWGFINKTISGEDKVKDFVEYCNRDHKKESDDRNKERMKARQELKLLHHEAIRCLDISVGAYDGIMLELQETIENYHDLL